MLDEGIPAHFSRYAADILGDTNSGLSGANIVKATADYAVEYDVNIPHTDQPGMTFTARHVAGRFS